MPNRVMMAVAVAKGGEIVGRRVTQCRSFFPGKVRNTWANAVTNPMKVPTIPTHSPSTRVFTRVSTLAPKDRVIAASPRSDTPIPMSLATGIPRRRISPITVTVVMRATGMSSCRPLRS